MFRLTFILLSITIISVQVYSVYESSEEELITDDYQRAANNDQDEDEMENKDQLTKFYEVDSYGPLFTDFGAETGDNGAFSWHATYPVSKSRYQWRQEWN